MSTGDGDATPSTSSDGGLTSRREVLAALGGASILSSTGGDARPADSAPVHVRVYPGPLPTTVWARHGWSGASTGWAPPFETAFEAIRDGFEQLESYAAVQGRLEGVDIVVERGGRVDRSLQSVDSPRAVVAPTRQQLLDSFRDVVHARGTLTGHTSHCLLWWGPLQYDVGYGGTRRPNGHVAAVPDEGAQVVANVGATERWDSTAVTRNIAIHEALHTFLASSVVETVVESRCDHDLGQAIRVDEGTLEVSPMATAYAGPNEVGGGTRFHGSGCANHERFHRHDGYDGVDRFVYTDRLSDATLEAVTRFVEWRLLEEG